MKKVILFLFATLSLKFSISQSQNWWKLDGSNTANSSSAIGTINFQPLRFKANGNEYLTISPTGAYTFSSLSSATKGVLGIDQSGLLFRTDYSGNSSDVLTGTGDFVSLGTLSGWTLNGNILFTNYNVGVGTNIVPEKLTVNGNILANGSISGTSLNVIDVITSGKEFKISTSLCMKGIDVNDPNSRNELCGMNGDLFIQSEHNNNYNTVFGLGNGSKTGFGVIPTEKFHVGVKAKFDDYVYMNKIIPNDSIFTIGENTIHFNTYGNNIWGSQTLSSSVKGIGFGSPSAYGYGVRSIAIGNRVRADGENSIIIGQSNTTSSPQFRNTIDNSLMIGFNSNIPTITVLPANGTGTTGNVGISTSNPQDRLQIGDDYTSLTFGRADFSSLNYGTSYIGFNSTRSNSMWNVKGDGANNGGAVIYNTIGGNLVFATLPSNGPSSQNFSDQDIVEHRNMILHSNGGVSIGTECLPVDYLFAVKGNMVAEEVVIKLADANNCWPDFVFNNNYCRPNYIEKEKYLFTNKHLPYLNSAKEIEISGINIGNTLSGITQNVEENTIDIIDIYHKLSALEQENERLKKEIEALKNK